MGDFMCAWAERRRLQVLSAQLMRREEEVRELSARPQHATRAATERWLRKSGGYASPVAGWQKRVKRWESHRAAVSSISPRSRAVLRSARSTSPGLGATAAGEVAVQPAWADVVQRLYTAPMQRLCAAPPEVLEPAAGERAPEPLPGTQGRRRFGRPPKATWEFLYEEGSRRLRMRSSSEPPVVVEHRAAPRPTPHYAWLLANGASRPPLSNPRLLVAAGGEPLARQKADATPRRRAPSSRATARAREPPAAASVEATEKCRAGGPDDRCIKLYTQCVERRAELERWRAGEGQKRSSLEMEECTFQPQTSCQFKASEFLAKGLRRDIGQSLYERAAQSEAYKRILHAESLRRREEEALQECTFQPQLCRSGPSVPQSRGARWGQQAAEFGPPSLTAAPLSSWTSPDASFTDPQLQFFSLVGHLPSEFLGAAAGRQDDLWQPFSMHPRAGEDLSGGFVPLWEAESPVPTGRAWTAWDASALARHGCPAAHSGLLALAARAPMPGEASECASGGRGPVSEGDTLGCYSSDVGSSTAPGAGSSDTLSAEVEVFAMLEEWRLARCVP